MFLHVPLQISKPSSDKFDTICSNLNLFLSNINDINPASSIAIVDFNARISKWWSTDKETFEDCAMQNLTTLVAYVGNFRSVRLNWENVLIMWMLLD